MPAYIQTTARHGVAKHRRARTMSGLSASYTDILVDKLNKVDAALDAIPRLQENSDTIKAYMPWATVALGVIGVGLVLFAARTMK